MKDLITQIAEAGLAAEQSRVEQIERIDAALAQLARTEMEFSENTTVVVTKMNSAVQTMREQLKNMRYMLEQGADASQELEGIRRIVQICRPASMRAAEAGLAAVSQATAAE